MTLSDPRSGGTSPASRSVHGVQSVAARTASAAAAAVVCSAVLGWALLSQHSDRILLWFEAVTSAVTIVMLFVLQHTQTRQQAAVQRKLDEVLRALPLADNRLIQLETASDAAIHAVERRHSAVTGEADDLLAES